MWLSGELETSIALFLPLIGLAMVVRKDPYIMQERRRIMGVVIALAMLLVVQNLFDADTQSAEIKNAPYLRTIASVIGYSVRPVIIVLFCHIVAPEKKHSGIWYLVMLNAMVNMTALFSPLSFWIDEINTFHRGPLGYICHIVSGIALAYLVWLTIQAIRTSRRENAQLPLFSAALILAAVLLDTFILNIQNAISLLTISIVSCCVFYYLWLHQLFVWEHEQALLAEQRIKIMISQIQPHFLYNTLSTIQALCRVDPEKAFTTTEKFGSYLRQNLDSLNRTELISIERELEHTRVYADIEAVRFPNVRVEYDAQDTDFLVPILTIQPLVENAITHGVRMLNHGVVTVATRRAERAHEITVRDNGMGFDTSVLEDAGGDHIGIRNVRERIESMCGGTFEIVSAPGAGTVVTIRIPEK